MVYVLCVLSASSSNGPSTRERGRTELCRRFLEDLKLILQKDKSQVAEIHL